MNRRTSAVAAAFIVAALGTAGCSAGSSHTAAGSPVAAATGGPLDLRGICPERIVVQVNWWPEVSRTEAPWVW